MAASQSRIGDTAEGFFHDSSDTAMAATAYKRAVNELDTQTAKQIDVPYRATVLDPISRLCSYFPEVNKIIEKRSKKLLDYDAARSRHKKLQEKPSDDPSRMPRAEKEYEEARLIFEAIDQQMMTELPHLVDMRIPYLDPSFEMMIRAQVRYAEEGYEQLGGVQRYFPENVRGDYADGRLDQQVESVLQEMRGLSICGGVTN